MKHCKKELKKTNSFLVAAVVAAVAAAAVATAVVELAALVVGKLQVHSRGKMVLVIKTHPSRLKK